MKNILLLFTALTLSLSAFADNDGQYKDLVDRLDAIEQSTDTLPISIVDNSVFIFAKNGEVIFAEIPQPDEPMTALDGIGIFLTVLLGICFAVLAGIGLATVTE